MHRAKQSPRTVGVLKKRRRTVVLLKERRRSVDVVVELKQTRALEAEVVNERRRGHHDSS